MYSHIVFAIALSLAVDVPVSPQPQRQDGLPQMFDIEWSAAPRMPQGMQDNDGGMIDSYLVMAGGFCHGIDNDWKPGIYPRGFLKKTWALDLENEQDGWIELPDFPGAPRQEMYGIGVNNEIYLWGGFSYTEPYAYTDGYKLSRQEGQWKWSPLPNLPRPGGAGGVAAVDGKIYLIGGMDYDAERYYVWSDRTDQIERYGSRLYVFDSGCPSNGWQELTACPGTPRMMSAVAAIGGDLYVMGGYAVDRDGKPHSVVDSWRYDPAAAQWRRLRDLPVSVSGFSTGSLVVEDRYILLATGYPHPTIMNPDGSIRTRYGEPSRVDRSQWKQHPRLEGVAYENHAWVYDTKTNSYGRIFTGPQRICLSTTTVRRCTLSLTPCSPSPGETARFWWQGEYFGHAAEFVLKGKIRVLNWQRCSASSPVEALFSCGETANNSASAKGLASGYHANARLPLSVWSVWLALNIRS